MPAGTPDDGPPAELVARYRAAARGRPVAPAARVSTVRHERRLLDAAGRVLAEVAEDTVEARDLVTGERQRWQEIEVELVDGDDALLDAVARRLRRAGARPVPGSKSHRALAARLAAARTAAAPGTGDAGPRRRRDRRGAGAGGTAVLGYLAAQRDTVVAHHPAAREGDYDAVHDMRVAIRRLRSTLRTFRGLWERRESEQVRAELGGLGRKLGAVRDVQVMAARLTDAVHAEPAELVPGPVAARITAHFAAEEAAAVAELRAALDGEHWTGLLVRLDALVEEQPVRRAGRRWVLRRVHRAVRRADDRLDRAMGNGRGGTADDPALHEARKAYKRARYAVEVVEPTVGDPAADLVRRFKRLQNLLGAHQDSVPTREALRRVALRAYADGENTFSYGLLYARQATTADRELDGLDQARDRSRRGRVRRWLEP